MVQLAPRVQLESLVPLVQLDLRVQRDYKDQLELSARLEQIMAITCFGTLILPHGQLVVLQLVWVVTPDKAAKEFMPSLLVRAQVIKAKRLVRLPSGIMRETLVKVPTRWLLVMELGRLHKDETQSQLVI
jgi:hypothetical protein